MPIDKCCVAPDEMRAFFFTGPSPIVYTVPVGKVFVVTAWLMVAINPAVTTAWMRRGTTFVSYSRIWESARQHDRVDIDPGIPFAAGESIEIDGVLNGNFTHIIYGYEQDV